MTCSRIRILPSHPYRRMRVANIVARDGNSRLRAPYWSSSRSRRNRMTRTTNAKVAGFAFLLYIAASLTGGILSDRASSGDGVAAKLASIGGHASQMRTAILLTLVGCFCALVLAVTLYSITRDQDPDLALLVLF